MDFFKENLPLVYLVGFLVLLLGTGIFVFLQIIKTRKVESSLNKLENKLKTEAGTAQEYYELGSIYLDKKLFVRAIAMLQKALKADGLEPEQRAPIYNALGYAYFGQEQYDLAIRQYKDAIKLEPEYVIAMNNLGHAYEQKNLTSQALEMYEKALELEPKNATAKRRSDTLRRRLVITTK
jgi:tetratricopeptide (TPR) repeat protein